MKRSLLRKGIAAVAALGVTAGLVAVVTPAQAAPPAGTKIIVATGSDTTEDFMEAYLVNPDPNGPGDNGRYNINALYDTGVTEFVPEDTAGSGTLCGSRTYYSTGTAPAPNPVIAPNGSTGGRDALKNTLTTPGSTGCYDIARSSSGPRTQPTDPASFQYHAFGLDVLSWSSPSLNAPASLTRDQIRGIYNCTFDTWDDVGGAPGPIQRYLPQSASGTRAFFISEFLSGIDLTVSTPTCPAIVQDASIQENDGTVLQVPSYQSAILPYSVGQWVFQANASLNPTLDKRNGVSIKNFQAVSTFTADTTTGSNQLVTATNNRFTAINVGGTVTGAGIPAGTTITAVAANGQTATLSQNATATGPVSVTRTSLPGAAARWITIAPGGWLPGTPNALNPRGPVSEAQVTLNNANRDYFGVRYLFNVISTASPQFVDARNLVGFDNIPAGAKSPLCNNGASSTILNAGFAPLSATTPSSVDPNRNLAGSTCRLFTPPAP